MALHNELGKHGEELAIKWLVDNGYKILQRNWKWGQNEVDVIATKGKFLNFIEIKTRNQGSYGHPEDSVNRQKFKSMQRVANGFLTLNPNYPWIEYQILSITLFKDGKKEFFLIRDVYL